MVVQGHGSVKDRGGMNILFRVDASTEIGTGHLMRCLTLADALRTVGHNIRFLSRKHAGHLANGIRDRGFSVDELGSRDEANLCGYERWLGTTEAQDAEDCASIIAGFNPDWVVVDHYALGERWESRFRGGSTRILAIDDLAERSHSCDLLLDQTWGRAPGDYSGLVPQECECLCGSGYALLRPEFAAQREMSLYRRHDGAVRSILVTMGGVDKDNATGQALAALAESGLHPETNITVVMGESAPWLNAVKTAAENMPWPTQVVSGVSDMAERMAVADLAIGAAGATAWERCCMGLPAILIVLADNQKTVAANLEQAGAAWVIDERSNMATELPGLLQALAEDPEKVKTMTNRAAQIADGHGAEHVLAAIVSKTEVAGNA